MLMRLTSCGIPGSSRALILNLTFGTCSRRRSVRLFDVGVLVAESTQDTEAGFARWTSLHRRPTKQLTESDGIVPLFVVLACGFMYMF